MKLALSFIIVLAMFSFCPELIPQEKPEVPLCPQPVVISLTPLISLHVSPNMGGPLDGVDFFLIYRSGPKGVLPETRLSVKTMEACGSVTTIEFSKIYRWGRDSKKTTLRITERSGFLPPQGGTPTSSMTAETETVPILLNGEPVPETASVSLKKIQGQFLLSVVERISEAVSAACQKGEDGKPIVAPKIVLDPTLRKDVETLMTSSPGDFYTRIESKKKTGEKSSSKPDEGK